MEGGDGSTRAEASAAGGWWCVRLNGIGARGGGASVQGGEMRWRSLGAVQGRREDGANGDEGGEEPRQCDVSVGQGNMTRKKNRGEVHGRKAPLG